MCNHLLPRDTPACSCIRLRALALAACPLRRPLVPKRFGAVRHLSSIGMGQDESIGLGQDGMGRDGMGRDGTGWDKTR
jgi:hypothetical protein